MRWACGREIINRTVAKHIIDDIDISLLSGFEEVVPVEPECPFKIAAEMINKMRPARGKSADWIELHVTMEE